MSAAIDGNDMNHRNRRSRSSRPSDDTEPSESGILNEEVLVLIFESINWDPQVLCLTACVSRKLRALAERLLWREHCLSRAPRMVTALARGAPNGRLDGGWQALAKLLCFCCGYDPSQNFRLDRPLPGHLAKETRFSKTSGQSFLAKRCRGDLLYISDPCEHSLEGNHDDLGIYRGIFWGFSTSRTRAFLIGRQVGLETRVRCPYCGDRVWSMTSARLVPKSASRRLGTQEGGLEYFVCLSGHLHGSCWLVPLSSDENTENDREDHDNDLDYSDDGDDSAGGSHKDDFDDQVRMVAGENGGRDDKELIGCWEGT